MISRSACVIDCILNYHPNYGVFSSTKSISVFSNPSSNAFKFGDTRNFLLICPSTLSFFSFSSTCTACCRNDGCVAAETYHTTQVKELLSGVKERRSTYIKQYTITQPHLNRTAPMHLQLPYHTAHRGLLLGRTLDTVVSRGRLWPR